MYSQVAFSSIKISVNLLKRRKELLLQVGITENSWSKFPSQLSGGEAQRVGIVRAIINNPKILFAEVMNQLGL